MDLIKHVTFTITGKKHHRSKLYSWETNRNNTLCYFLHCKI